MTERATFIRLRQFRNYYGLMKIARCGFPWKKTTNRPIASVYSNCETAFALAIRIVYAFCLAAATYNHAVVLIHHGWDWNYGGMPMGIIVFWTSLTLLDPLVAVLLFLKPKAAVIMLVILMVSDVANNTWVILKYGGQGWMVACQWIFLTFVVMTISFVWRATSE
jgi:hypothetical protein